MNLLSCIKINNTLILEYVMIKTFMFRPNHVSGVLTQGHFIVSHRNGSIKRPDILRFSEETLPNRIDPKERGKSQRHIGHIGMNKRRPKIGLPLNAKQQDVTDFRPLSNKAATANWKCKSSKPISRWFFIH